MNLKIGGSNVGKIMYNGQEIGGATKLEPGTIVYRGKPSAAIRLLSVDSQWDNISKLRINGYGKPGQQNDELGNLYSTIDRSLIELKQSYTTTDLYKFTVVESEANGDKVLSVKATSVFETIEVMVL